MAELNSPLVRAARWSRRSAWRLVHSTAALVEDDRREHIVAVRVLVAALCLGLALFHLYTGLFGTLDAMLQRTVHLGIALLLIFLTYPMGGTAGKWARLVDGSFIVLMASALGYIYWNIDYLTQVRIPAVTPVTWTQLFLAAALVLCILEAIRRSLGLPLTIVVGGFILYYFTGPYLPGAIGYRYLGAGTFVDIQYLTLEGTFGLALGISATFIPLFIIFGRIMHASGFGGFLTDFAMGVAGHTRGGPAKVSVISSALFGTINGSSTANALTTGNFTIPLMVRSGFSRHFAAGVESAASTGGQILPPVMGAAAFLMAEFARIPYATIMMHAILPALLFFLGVFVTVDMEAKKLGLKGIRKEELPNWKSEAPKYLHMLVPVVVLVWLIIANRSPMYAISVATVFVFVFSYARRWTRMSLPVVLSALVSASRDVVAIAAATAAVGIIVGIVGVTGLGIKLSAAMVALSEGYLLASLLLAFLGALVLGMTMNTAAVYLLLVALIIPGLIRVGLSVPQAHFFGLYFGVLAQITPPVAVTAYAAAGLAKADMNKTGFAAVMLCASGFVIPFMFAYSPELLLIGSWSSILLAIPSAVIGVSVISIAVVGFWLVHMRWYERVAALGGALLSIQPGGWTDSAGLALIGVVFFMQLLRSRAKA